MPVRSVKTAAIGLVALLSLGAVVALAGGAGDDHDGDEAALTTSDKAMAATGAKARPNAMPSAEVPPGAPAPAASAAPEEAGAQGAADSDSGGGGQATYLGGSVLPGAATARVVKTATLTVGVGKGKLTDAGTAVDDLIARVGGYQQSSERDKDQASFTLRVPADKFDAALVALRGLGDPRNETVSGEDMTAEYVDLEARLRHWRAQEAVFLDLMTRAKTIPDSISVQQQLSGVQQQIEQIEGRRRLLESQTDYSTIRLTLAASGASATTKAKAVADRSILARSWDTAAGAALAVLGGTLIVLGVAVPLALVAGIPALVFFLARRRRVGPTTAVPAA